MSGLTIHFSPEFVRMVGWTLLHFVWQGAAVATLLALALAVSKRATVRYAMGVGALLLMLALPFITFFVLQQPKADFTSSNVEDVTAPPLHSAAPGPLTHHHSYAAAQSDQSRPEAIVWLVRIWMIGVVLFSVRSAGGFLLVQRLRRIATIPATGELLRLCVAVQRQMGIERAVRFCRSAALQVPAVVGGIRPIVLLPITALTGLSDAQIEAIVAHELAHIQRLDYFVNVFQVFAETVLFYHPAVWWVNKRIRIERENCCDDTAIAVCGNRLEYVRALTHLESARIMPQFAMAANGSPLKARVRRLLGMAEEAEGVRGSSSVLGVLVIAGIVLAASSLATGAKAQVETPQIAATPAAPASPSASAQAAPVAAPAIAPAPESEPAASEAPEPMIANTEVFVHPVEVHVPMVNVAVPAIHVQVPAVNIATTAVHMYVPAVNVAMPAMQVRMPMLDINIARMHPMMAQTNGTGASEPARSGESYIDGMKAAGYGDLTVDELVAMKVQGITPDYVREMKAAGFKVDADDLIAMKVQGVTPEYAKRLRASYPGIDVDTIVAFKVQGVTPEYAAGFAQLGIKADADELIALKVQGVTAEYVRDMRATGINFDTDELIGMKIQGVTPAFVNSLKSAGISKLDADEIVGARAMGITPEFIEKAKSHGFKDLDLDKLIELKNANVL
jgi:beta-lactamase regulating signal transducer with metallopeptidase domain